MKRIFIIIASIFIALILALLIVLGSVKKSLSFDFKEPYYINIYNKSSTTINNKSFYATDKEYGEVIEMFGKTTKSSLLNLLLKTGSMKYRIELDKYNYATYDTSMKSDNLVIELVYQKLQNIIVYDEGNPRVIAFYCLLIVIPPENKFEDIVIYNSMTNDTNDNNVEKEYKKNVPFVVKGNPKQLLDYVSSLTK